MNKATGIGSLASFFLLLTVSGMAWAQQPPSQKAPENQLFRGKMLMDNKAYGSATAPLDAYAKKDRTGLKGEEAQVLSLVSAVRAGQEGSEQVLKAYAESNQGSPYSQLAYRELGNRAFVEKQWDRTVLYYTEAGLSGLSQHDLAVQNFKHGYALLSLKEFDQARARFEASTKAEHEYQPAAYYYTAYLQMREGKYDEALTNLSKAERDKTYRGYAPLLRANLYYRQGRYDDVLEEARKFKSDSSAGLQGVEDMSLLAGEAYYMKGDFAKAGQNYNLYLTKNKSGLSKGLQYRIGYAQYRSGKFDKAVPSFSAAAQKPDTLNGKRDTLSQMASYYLGASYLQQKNKQFALNAFTQAMNTPGDSVTTEQATLATGKLLFDLGRYEEALRTMQAYKQRYPDSPQESEADEVVGESYLNSGNFETALAYIQSVRKKTPRILSAFQRVTYQKGIKLFNDDSTAEAAKFFERSLQYPNDAETVTLAHYWAGESWSAEGDWAKAQGQYQSFMQRPGVKQNPYYAKGRYGLGYAFFNQKQYDKALPQFREFVDLSDKTPGKPFYNSGILRLADCYYAAKDYSRAGQTYDRAIKERNPESDYALYQMALCQSAQGQLTEAEQTLTRMSAFPNSRYRDEAAFQRAQLALDQGRYQDAVAQFSEVIRLAPNSTTAPYAFLKRGVAYSNLKEFDKASADYKKILNDYPGNAAAENAIEGLRESLTNEGKIEDFADYLAQYKKANPESGSTEGLEFDAAKGLYFSQKYQKAVGALESYVKSYPESNLRGEAYFYIGEAYYRLNDRLKAIESHEKVVEDGKSNYVTRSLQRLGEMENTGGNYEKSLAYYRRLNTLSRNRKEQVNSMVGQMESYFEMGRLDSALALADEVLRLPNVTLDAQNKATLYHGKIAYANNDMEKATDDFLTTLNTAKDVNGAEAQYLIGEILFKKKEYRQSLDALFKLNEDFAQFQRWKDKAFLLIADDYIGMGETFQATATLNSIIANSPDKKTKDAAKAKLDALKSGDTSKEAEN